MMKNLIPALICLFLVTPCQAGIIYVDANGTGDYTTIQAAINDSNDGDIIVLQPGTYTGDGNRDINFSGKAITVKSSNPDDNSVVESTIIDCEGTWENSHRGFIFDSNEGHDSLLSGITITNGNFMYIGGSGGAIYCSQSSPTISKCRIIDNDSGYGGGIACIDSNAILSNCLIKGNYTEGCGSNGGGIYCRSSSVLIKQCVITENNARDRQGGGILCNDSNCVITQCLISGNKSAEEGGGIACVNNSHSEINSCTIADNRSSGAGGIRVYCAHARVSNSILWGNRASEGNQIGLRGGFDDKGEITLSYCDIEGLQQGVYIDWQGELNLETGNINEDSMFIQPGQWDDNGTPDWIHDDFFLGAGDYHLKSFGWRWDSEANEWTWDDVTSRCIDAGNPGSPLADELMSVPDDPCNIWGENIRINMGAYGGIAEASMPPYDWTLLSDMTNDGTVNFVDFAHTADMFTEQEDELPGDFDRDGDVDYADIALLTEDWLRDTSWHE